MRTFQHLLLCLGPLLAASAVAATTFTLETGKPVEVDYGDGRRAELRVGRRPATSFAATFAVAESTCGNGAAAGRGSAAFGAKDVRFELIWTAHPSAEKIGQAVVMRPKGVTGFMFQVSAIPSMLTAASRKTMPIASADLPADHWESDDFSWLPPGTPAAPAQTFLVRWDAEYMRTNPETGLMENRSQNLASGVTLERTSDRRLEVAAVRQYGSSLTGFLLGDVWALVLREGEGYCQISLKPNLVDLQRLVNAYFEAPLPAFVPYRYGEDELSDKANQAFFFTQYVTQHEGFDVE